MNRKRLVHTINLRFFEDDANGEWGLTHDKTIGQDGNGFNAFYSAHGIFHDVWEHWFEHEHRLFRGEYAMNVGGEMAAMGAMWYYYSDLGLYERPINPMSIYSFSEQMRRTTQDLVTEAIGEGYCQFGDTLESNVPHQRPVDNRELEYEIREFISKVKEYTGRRGFSGPQSADMQEYEQRQIEYGQDYRRSVTFRKVADLHRWGYRMAEKLVPNVGDNRQTLSDFLSFWSDFCKRNPAEELAQSARGIQFKIYLDSDGAISWKAYLNLMQGARQDKILITNDLHTDDILSMYIENEE